MSKLRSTLAVTAVLAASVALAGCASPSGSPSNSMPSMDHASTPMSSAPPAGASFNIADLNFINGMIPHHSQAVAMSDTLLKKAGIDPAVVALATKIKGAQDPEIVTMKSWLTSWKMANTSDLGMRDGMGMMSDADMSALDAATGVSAAKLFLTQMTQHHEGAIEMAKTEISKGKDPRAVTLAKKIAADQSAEIKTIKSLLATL